MLDEGNLQECTTHLLPINITKGSAVGFDWGEGYRLAIFKKFNQPENTTILDKDSSCYEIKWNISLHSSVMRKLVNESHGIFKSLQLLKKDETSSSRSQLVKVSHNYRSVIKVCIENLKTSIESSNNPNFKEELDSYCQIFYKIELVWNLCEILFINIQPGGVIMCQLLDWIQWHFTSHRKYLEEILTAQNPTFHPNYWNSIYAHILQGRLDDARKMLRLHPDFPADHFQSIDELLRKMPFISSYSGNSMTEFNLRWQQWREECLSRYENGDFLTDDNLSIIIKILCGDRTVFLGLKSLMETWYHYMVSWLLFTNPCFKIYELNQVAKESMDVFIGQEKPNYLDIILLSAIQFDLQEVISGCYGCMDQWFASHLTDLLYHCEQTKSEKLSHGHLLREALLLDYANSLMSHKSLWEVGVDYFDYCPKAGRHQLELHLERIPLTSYHKSMKVYTIAVKRDMHELAHSICKVMGQKTLQKNRLGSALTWAIKSKDATFASFLADRILNDYAVNGNFQHLDLLDNLGSCMLVSDRLTFLGKYCEFHKMYKSKDFQAAGNLLISLLTSQIAPKYFWLALLLDALPLLECQDPVFNSSQTQELMYCLEELCWKSLSVKADKKLLKEKEELIRIALARNLARTFIQEGSDFV